MNLAARHVDSNGNVTVIPYEGDRFLPQEWMLDHMKANFGYMNGWVILEALVGIVLYFKRGCIVEIGSGESTRVLAKAAHCAGVPFYSCDKAERKNCGSLYKCHTHYQLTSDQFMDQFFETPAVVLIDADHRYAAAKKEFEFFFNKLMVGGVVFLHDTFPPHKVYLEDAGCSDVYKLRQELEQKTDEMDCFTWPYTAGYMGLTMVIKKDPDRPIWGK